MNTNILFERIIKNVFFQLIIHVKLLKKYNHGSINSEDP